MIFCFLARFYVFYKLEFFIRAGSWGIRILTVVVLPGYFFLVVGYFQRSVKLSSWHLYRTILSREVAWLAIVIARLRILISFTAPRVLPFALLRGVQFHWLRPIGITIGGLPALELGFASAIL